MSTPPASAASSYKDTLNLLDTPFAMRANAKKREPELQAFWAEHRIYERLGQEAGPDGGGTTFTLHDGPPYANGDLPSVSAFKAHLPHFGMSAFWLTVAEA